MSPRAGEDPLRDLLVGYTHGLSREDVTDDDLRIVRHLLLDTLCAVIAGSEAEPVTALRSTVTPATDDGRASVLGTSVPAPPAQAALVNGTAARVAEMNDVYVSKIGLGSHPSDMTMPILAAAQAAGASGLEVALALLGAYEVYMEMADSIDIEGFDAATFAGMGVALGASRVMGLDEERTANALGIVAITHNPLVQTRRGRLTMWKAVAAGHAGSNGVHAALLARAGVEAPAQPFVGRDGWGQLIARSALDVALGGGGGRPMRMHEVTVKPRAACQNTISSILAAEDAASRLVDLMQVKAVLVETYAFAKEYTGSGAERWDPQTPETADHSIPYVVAAALHHGRVGPASFTQERLWDGDLRDLMAKVEVVAREDYSAANEQRPQQHPTRVVVTLMSGERVEGRTGFDRGDLTDAPTWEDLVAKFREVAGGRLAAGAVDRVIDAVANLEELPDITPLVRAALSA
jgi:2-methylcitrate dehydratase